MNTEMLYELYVSNIPVIFSSLSGMEEKFSLAFVRILRAISRSSFVALPDSNLSASAENSWFVSTDRLKAVSACLKKWQSNL